nr:glycosyltransferase family 90 protein [Trichoderma aurantioeffusum]
MQLHNADDIEPLAGYAGAALLCSLLTQWLSFRESEIYSEILCWATLPILIEYQKQLQQRSLLGPVVSGESKVPTPSPSSLWMAAGSVAMFLLCKMETDVVQFLVRRPALTPLLLAYQNILDRFQGRQLVYFRPLPAQSGVPLWSLFLAFLRSQIGISKHPFSPSCRPLPFWPYMLFCYQKMGHLRFSHPSTLSMPSTPIRLCLGILIFGWYVSSCHRSIKLLTIIQAQSTSWSTASLISTFSIASTSNPLNKPSDFQAAAYICASLISLGQLVSQLPKQVRFRLILWSFGLISFIPFLSNVWMIRDEQHSAKIFGPEREHPVESLMRSKAVEEYQRRYGVGPPPGFEAWYDFAVNNQSPVIDDFDMIYNAISPIWRLSGQQVLEIMNQVYFVPNGEMWFCIFYGGYATTRCIHPDRIYDRHIEFQFDRLLHGLKGVLPDVRFLFNHFDEPRILIPKWQVEDGLSYQQFKVRNISRQPVWDEITKFCASEGKGNMTNMHAAAQIVDLPFVEDRSSAIDLCVHPEYRNLHGLFMSPVSFPLVEGLIPALSTGSPSTMGDILFPSPAYTELEFTYDDAREVDWDQKRNNFYWAGSTTGGFASGASWSSFHRQRFVKLAQNIERQQHYYLREVGGTIQRVASSFLNSRLFDVAFTKIFQCERKLCRDQKRYFKVGDWADKDKALWSRLVFDLDGNGISGRYYKLLASKSAPMKQTLLREWHDDRLMPWVHYIPVSQSLEELPELVLYLTSTKAGQNRAREIAEQGRDWFFKALREADMAVYAYRLLLELARLQDPNREAGFPAAG